MTREPPSPWSLTSTTWAAPGSPAPGAKRRLPIDPRRFAACLPAAMPPASGASGATPTALGPAHSPPTSAAAGAVAVVVHAAEHRRSLQRVDGLAFPSVRPRLSSTITVRGARGQQIFTCTTKRDRSRPRPCPREGRRADTETIAGAQCWGALGCPTPSSLPDTVKARSAAVTENKRPPTATAGAAHRQRGRRRPTTPPGLRTNTYRTAQ